MFKNHLEMIGRNETPSKKAKFWQSYIRSLKGSEDIRAQETPKTRSYRPLSSLPEFTPSFRSIYDDHSSPAERISGAGYRYLPVHRDTYGYSPRPIYERSRPTSSDTKAYDPERAWNEHLDRMSDIEKRYPSRYGLYLKDKPSTTLTPLTPLEYEPDNKPSYADGRLARAGSVPPMRSGSPARFAPRGREMSVPPLMPLSQRVRGTSLEPLLEDLFKRELPLHSSTKTPTPIKAERWPPRESEVAFDKEGLPIYRNPAALQNLLNPSPNLPISAVTRDPWWWRYPELKPATQYMQPSHRMPAYLRDSFLSPVKKNFLWKDHPLRPMERKACGLPEPNLEYPWHVRKHY